MLQYVVKSATMEDGIFLGYVPDIMNILKKYKLETYLQTYISSGYSIFPTSFAWKSIIKKSVQDYEQLMWEARTRHDPEFSLFANIQTCIYKPARVWLFERKFPNMIEK